MTIFDVIRYPISDNPTNEEIERLPKDLVQKWRSRYTTKEFQEARAEDIVPALRKEILCYGETRWETFIREFTTVLKKRLSLK